LSRSLRLEIQVALAAVAELVRQLAVPRLRPLLLLKELLYRPRQHLLRLQVLQHRHRAYLYPPLTKHRYRRKWRQCLLLRKLLNLRRLLPLRMLRLLLLKPLRLLLRQPPLPHLLRTPMLCLLLTTHWRGLIKRV
jgi:hypothetical protein